MKVDHWRFWLLTFDSEEEAEEYKEILLDIKEVKRIEQLHDEHLGIPDGKETE